MTDEELLIWFRERGEYLSLERIAKKMDVPSRSLRAWVAGTRPLPDQHRAKIITWIKWFRE